MKNKDIHNEIKEIAPGLSKLSNVNPFEVPADYFTDLPDMIAQRRSRRSVHPFFAVLSYIFQPRLVTAGLTAVILILIFLIPGGNMTTDRNLAQYEQQLFDEQLAWYSEYQKDVYYELLYDTDPAADTELPVNENYQEDQTIEYLLQYKEYYMD